MSTQVPEIEPNNSSEEDSSAPSSETTSSSEMDLEYLKKMCKTDPPNTLFVRFSFTDDAMMKQLCSDYYYYIPIVYQRDRIHIKLSPEEKAEKKKEYRSQYRQRDYVKKKAEQDRADPVKVQKRKEYSMRCDVKKRKADLARAKRAYLKELRKDPQSDFAEYIKLHVPPLPKLPKEKLDENNNKEEERGR